MGFNLKKFLDDSVNNVGRAFGSAADAVVPGNQANWHRPAAPPPRASTSGALKVGQAKQQNVSMGQSRPQNVSVAQPRYQQALSVARPITMPALNVAKGPATKAPKKKDLLTQLSDFTDGVNKATFGTALNVAKATPAAVSEFTFKGKDNRNFGDNAVDMIAGNTARLVNTANAGVVQPITSLLQGKSEAQTNADMNKNLFTDRGGLLGVGTFFPNQEQYNKTFKDPGSFTKGFTGAGVATATEVAPIARGTSLLLKPGLSTGAKVTRGAAEGAVYGAGGTAGQQLLNQENLDAGKIAAGGALGAVVGGGIPLAGAGVKATGKKVAKEANKVYDAQNIAAQRAATVRDEQLLARNNMQRAFDVETDPVRRGQISKGIADLNTQMRQGGFAKIPGKGSAPQVGKTDPLESLKQEAKKYKSAEEFVKAQGEPVYHRSQNKFDKFDISKVSNDSNRQRYGWGLYFSDTIPHDQYGKNLYEARLPKGTFIDSKQPVDEKIVSKIAEAVKGNNKNPSELGEFSYNGYLFYKTLSRILGGDKEASLFLSKNGIDGLKSNIGKNANDYILFNDKSISTNQQLTDLYNQATQSQPPKSPLANDAPQGKLDLSKLSDDELNAGFYEAKNNTSKILDDPQYRGKDGLLTKQGQKLANIEIAKATPFLDEQKARVTPAPQVGKTDLTTKLDIHDATKGESYGTIVATRNGKTVGKMDVSITDNGDIHVNNVEVPEAYRRQGIATELYKKAQQESRSGFVQPTGQTELGAATRKSLESKGIIKSRPVPKVTAPTPFTAQEWDAVGKMPDTPQKDALIEKMNRYDNDALSWRGDKTLSKPVIQATKNQLGVLDSLADSLPNQTGNKPIIPQSAPQVGKTLKDGELYSTANSYVSFGSDSTGGVISYNPKGTGSVPERISYNKLSQKTRDELVSAELEYKNARANSTSPVAPGTVTETQIAKGRLELAQSNAIEELGLQEHASIQGARLADGTKPTVQKPFLDRYTDWLESKWKSKEYSDAQIQDMESNPNKYKAQFESETSANSPEISRLQQKVDAAKADLNNPQVDSRFAHEQLAKAQRELAQAPQPKPEVTQPKVEAPQVTKTPELPILGTPLGTKAAKETVAPLANEALKFKTATDFANSQLPEGTSILDPRRKELQMIWEQANPRVPRATAPKQAAKPIAQPEQPAGYGMSHRPANTAPSHNLEQAAPDIYQHPEWYTTGDKIADSESLKTIQSIKANPNAEVTIYRASPKNEFNHGDWVTLSKEYANQESKAEGVKVYSKTVKASEIGWPGDSINEFGYFPDQAQSVPVKAPELPILGTPLGTKAAKETKTERLPAPETKGKTLYRGIDERELNALQSGGVTNSSRSVNRPDRAFIATDKDLADMAVENHIRHGKNGYIVEYKPGTESKIVGGGSMGHIQNPNNIIEGEYLGQNLGINDVAKITDSKGNIVYDASTPIVTKTPELPILGTPLGTKAAKETVAPLATDVERALNAGSKVKEKTLNTRLANSDKTPQFAKDMLGGTYVEQSNKITASHARRFIRQFPQEAEHRALAPKNAVDVEIGSQLYAKYMSQGNVEKAVDFVNASESTNLGQMVQILSNYDKTTPQGAIRFAQSAINKYNKAHRNSPLALNAKDVEAIHAQAEKIQQMPQGEERNMASQQLMDTVNRLIPSTKTDKALALWKAGLLTSPRTHLRNILGNTVHAGAEIAKDPIAAANDMLLSVKTGKRTTAATLRGTVAGAKEGAKIAKDVVTTGFDPTNDIVKFDVQKVNWGDNPFGKAGKAYTEAVFRTLGAEDKVFYHSAFKRSLYDQAIAQAKNAGKEGDKTFVENLANNPNAEMMKVATQDASISTFKDRNKLSEIASSVKQKLSSTPAGKALGEITMPFTGVPSSIAGQMVAYSPIGLLKAIAKDVKVFGSKKLTKTQVLDLQRQASKEMGRGVIGTGLIGIGAYLTQQGLLTGQPKDIEEAKQWELEGKQANSVLVNGKWRSINSVGPEALVALAGSKMSGSTDPLTGAANIGKDFMGQTFLQGVQGPLNAITDPSRYAQTYISQQLSSVVPNIVKDTAKSGDSTARETSGDNIGSAIGNAFKTSIPGLRNDALPKRDVLGNPLAQEPTGVSSFVDLFNSKTPRSNPVIDELKRLNVNGASATPSALNKNVSVSGNKIRLTMQQLDTLEKESGGVLSQEMTKLFGSGTYKQADDTAKSEAIQKLTTSVRKQIKEKQFSQGGWRGVPKYEDTADAPKNFSDVVNLYTNALVSDPVANFGNVARGVFTSDQARKMRGNTLVLKRDNGLSAMDGGNKQAQVDHKIPLSLGGTNDTSNMEYLSDADNQRKSVLEVQLGKKLEAKQITKAQAADEMNKFIKTLKTVQPGSGAYVQKPFDTSSQRTLTKSTTSVLGGSSPADKYKANVAKYQEDKAAGKLTGPKQYAAEQSLAKESVTSQYSQEVLDFYKLSKAQQSAYFSSNRAKATELYDKAKELDGKLVDKGLATTKFKNGLSTTKGSTKSGTKSSTGKSKTGSKTSNAKKGKYNYAGRLSTTKGLATTNAIRNLVKKPKITRKKIS